MSYDPAKDLGGCGPFVKPTSVGVRREAASPAGRGGLTILGVIAGVALTAVAVLSATRNNRNSGAEPK